MLFVIMRIISTNDEKLSMGYGILQCNLSRCSDYGTPAGVLFYAAGSITAANLITIIILSLGIVGPLIAASNFADSLGMVGTVVNEITALLDGPELVRPTADSTLA